MALSASFNNLWTDTNFQGRVQAVIVDEAHCIDEWGGDKFRPVYRKLSKLRDYTGQETKTFDIIWRDLEMGHRPFWGIDVGCARPNLTYLTRILQNTENPVLDILNILPKILDASTLREAIDKALLYFPSEAACRLAVRTLRKVLPPHLRDYVMPYSSDGSDEGKAACWQGFMDGKIRIICATDAAGMGCNVPDVRYSIIFSSPRTLSVLSQRWGRAGRDRNLAGVCILLVPEWAYRPIVPAVNPAIQRVKGKAMVKEEPKRDATQRANLNTGIEAFINSAQNNGQYYI